MTNFLRCQLPVFIFLSALVGINSGCDLGTYAERAANAGKGYKPPAVTEPAGSAEKEKKMAKDDQP